MMRVLSNLLIAASIFSLVTGNAIAAGLTDTQASSLIAVVQSSPGTPASAFVPLITSFSNITVAQAGSLITVVQAAPGVPATAFVDLLVSFTYTGPISSSSSSTATTSQSVQTNTTPPTNVLTEQPPASQLVAGQITSVSVSPDIELAGFDWYSDVPSTSKVFVYKSGTFAQVFQSQSGLSTHHIASATGLTENTPYSYEIEIIANGIATKKSGTFTTKPVPPQTVSVSYVYRTDAPYVAIGNTQDRCPTFTFTSGKALYVQKIAFNAPGAQQWATYIEGENMQYAGDVASLRVNPNSTKQGKSTQTYRACFGDIYNQPTIDVTLLGSESVINGADGKKIEIADVNFTY